MSYVVPLSPTYGTDEIVALKYVFIYYLAKLFQKNNNEICVVRRRLSTYLLAYANSAQSWKTVGF